MRQFGSGADSALTCTSGLIGSLLKGPASKAARIFVIPRKRSDIALGV